MAGKDDIENGGKQATRFIGLNRDPVDRDFKEEEEGTGVASDVVKVQGEDPATPGPLP